MKKKIVKTRLKITLSFLFTLLFISGFANKSYASVFTSTSPTPTPSNNSYWVTGATASGVGTASTFGPDWLWQITNAIDANGNTVPLIRASFNDNTWSGSDVYSVYLYTNNQTVASGSTSASWNGWSMNHYGDGYGNNVAVMNLPAMHISGYNFMSGTGSQTFTINQYKWDGISAYLDSNNYVHIQLHKNESWPNIPQTIVNLNNGKTLSFTAGSATDFDIVDSSVQTGVTYQYNIQSDPSVATSILVPSDAQKAVIAAQAAQTAAQTAAQQASQNASNASAAANSIINNYLSTANGIVQDSSGTVLTAARVASTNAQNAYNAAQNAVTGINNAQNALSSKIDSSTSTIGSKIDSSASSLQTNLGNKIDSSLSNLQTNLNNSITNIQSVMPPILTKVSGYNGATATKTGSINLTLDYSNATDYQIKVDNGAWGAWSSLSSLDTNGYITASGLSTTGVHTIYVQIRNGSNNPALAKGKFTCFEL